VVNNQTEGAWEMDEEIEESAIRETYEEGGVLGVLGPKLSEFQCKTKKAREKRLALGEQTKETLDFEGHFCYGLSNDSQLAEEDHLTEKDKPPTNTKNAPEMGFAPETISRSNQDVKTS